MAQRRRRSNETKRLGLKRLRTAGLQALSIIVASAVVGLLHNRFKLEPLALTTESVAQALQDAYYVEGAIGPSLEQVRAFHRAGSALFVDARPLVRYVQGHIAGATSLPEEEFIRYFSSAVPQLLKSLDMKLPIVVYGEDPTSREAHALVDSLAESGFEGILVYSGGWEEWKANGLPVETGIK